MSKRKPYELSQPAPSARTPWSSLETRDEELAYSNELRERRAAEFSPNVTEGLDPVSRRAFLSIMGASVALATLEGCRRPEEHIMPYSHPPEAANVIDGVPLHYATVIDRRGDAVGLLVESHEGRPTKIEGNKDHPASLGGADLVMQASVLDLYDPDRSQRPSQMEGAAQGNGAVRRTDRTWADFDRAFGELLTANEADGGATLRVLAQPSASPTFVRLRDRVMARFPRAKFHTWESASLANVREGARLAFGSPVNTVHDFSRAKVILSLDSDFLQNDPGGVRAMRGFADARRLNGPSDEMNRLYAVESTMTITGANADHRLRLPAKAVEAYALALASRVGGEDLAPIARGANPPAGVPAQWIEGVAADLSANRGTSLVIAGPRQPASVHALAHALNHALGNVGTTVRYTPVVDPNEPEAAQGGDLRGLVQAIEAGQVQTLVILGGNPVYDAPGDLDFRGKLARVRTSVHFSLTLDETSERCSWHAPRAHYLETWGDGASLDGALAIQQPLIAPLYWGRSDIEVLATMANEPARDGHSQVRATYATTMGGLSGLALDRAWRRALRNGVLENVTPAAASNLALLTSAIAQQVASRQAGAPVSRDNLEVVFLTDNKLVDGRHANNVWLVELPDPVTKITWDNAAYLSPATARALEIDNGDMIRLTKGGRSIEIAAWIQPGQPDNSIAMNLGWGRTRAGRVGNGRGFDVNPLRSSEALHFMDGVTLAKAGGERYRFSQTQEHHRMEQRPIALDATLEEFRANPAFVQEHSPTPRTLPLWQGVDYTGRNKWGLNIDLNACTGCNACAIACQAENNVPAVGKEQVYRGREMHWLRVDRYFVGSIDDPEVIHQPLMCVQCENAPCENVCPVNATVHSPEGLNDMVYNRCIGTRYCSNNCPYKVRRFNYLNWQRDEASVWQPSPDVPETVRMQHNPQVSVRFRGVMEKCTYCVQRIQTAKIAAKREGQGHWTGEGENRVWYVRIADQTIKTACQQTCPADAIVFGDLNDTQSRVAQAARNPRGYKLLAELGTQPRTTYLARVRNPNPAMGSTNEQQQHAEAQG